MRSAVAGLAPRPMPCQEVTIARRAMACDFSITLPGETAGAVDAGIEALDEVDRVEGLLSVYRAESGFEPVERGGGCGAGGRGCGVV